MQFLWGDCRSMGLISCLPQAHVCRSSNPDEVEVVMAVLMENNKIRNATHNIMAYRMELAEKGTFIQDYDDDRENAAGGRLLHLLQVRVVCSHLLMYYLRVFSISCCPRYQGRVM